MTRRKRPLDGIDDDIRDHIERETQDHIERGLSPQEARRQAMLAFGSIARVQEETRAVWTWVWLDELRQDARDALRTLRRSPMVAAAAVLTLALGLGAASAVFTAVNTVLLEPLPYPEPDRIVQVWERGASGGRAMPSDPNFEDLYREHRSFQSFAQYAAMGMPITIGRETTQMVAAWVSGEFFDVLGAQPTVGRAFLPDELHPGAQPVAVVSQGMWRRHFPGRSDLTGATLRIGHETHAIVGVMPPGFRFPFDADVWTPREQWDVRSGRTGRNFRAAARLAPGVTLAHARTDLSALAARLRQQHGDDTWMVDVALVPLQEEIVAGVRPALMILLAAAGFLLIVACANLLNLLLALGAARARERAVRAALGAGQWRLTRQTLVETALLAMAGAALGILVAFWSAAVIRRLEPAHLPRLGELAVGWPVVAFAVAVAVAITVVLGATAAWRTRARDLHLPLRDSRGTIGSSSPHRIRHALVVVQIAFTLMLLVGAGLLARSLVKLLDTQPGFRTSGVALLHLYHPPLAQGPDIDDAASADAAKSPRVQQLDRIVHAMSALPGVAHAGLVSSFPLTGGGPYGTFVRADARPDRWTIDDFVRLVKDASRTGTANYLVASEGYFRAADIPLLRGRLFDERDTIEAPHVALISETLARAQWPDTDPIGRRIQFGNMDGDLRVLTIVGVVGDVRDEGLDAASPPMIYTCYRQRPQKGFSVVLQTAAGTADIAPLARARAREVAPDVPTRFVTVEEVLGGWLGWRRAALLLLGIFAMTALLLAVTGLYGAMAYAVAQQTREIGVRAALGAGRGSLLRLVLGRGLLILAGGLAMGTALSLALAGFLRTLLFGIAPSDPLTIVAASALLATVAMAACYVPARRATRVDPAIVLRCE